MTNYDIVKKLIGEINPVGETYEDARRLNNLREIITLVDKLVFDIDKVAMNKSRVEFSLKEAGNMASNFLDDLGIKP